MTVAEMLFIITKIIVKRAYSDGLITYEEYADYKSRFSEIEEEECES